MSSSSEESWLASVSTVLSLRALMHLNQSRERYEEDKTEALPIDWFVENSYQLRYRVLYLSKEIDIQSDWLEELDIAATYLEIDHIDYLINRFKKERLYSESFALKDLIMLLDRMGLAWDSFKTHFEKEIESGEYGFEKLQQKLDHIQNLSLSLIAFFSRYQ